MKDKFEYYLDVMRFVMENLEFRGNELFLENCLNFILYFLNLRCVILLEESIVCGIFFLKFEIFDVCFVFFFSGV